MPNLFNAEDKTQILEVEGFVATPCLCENCARSALQRQRDLAAKVSTSAAQAAGCSDPAEAASTHLGWEEGRARAVAKLVAPGMRGALRTTYCPRF